PPADRAEPPRRGRRSRGRPAEDERAAELDTPRRRSSPGLADNFGDDGAASAAWLNALHDPSETGETGFGGDGSSDASGAGPDGTRGRRSAGPVDGFGDGSSAGPGARARRRANGSVDDTGDDGSPDAWLDALHGRPPANGGAGFGANGSSGARHDE